MGVRRWRGLFTEALVVVGVAEFGQGEHLVERPVIVAQDTRLFGPGTRMQNALPRLPARGSASIQRAQRRADEPPSRGGTPSPPRSCPAPGERIAPLGAHGARGPTRAGPRGPNARPWPASSAGNGNAAHGAEHASRVSRPMRLVQRLVEGVLPAPPAKEDHRALDAVQAGGQRPWTLPPLPPRRPAGAPPHRGACGSPGSR